MFLNPGNHTGKQETQLVPNRIKKLYNIVVFLENKNLHEKNLHTITGNNESLDVRG